MDFLKSWIINITVISIIISIVSSIAPNGNLEKVIKFVSSGLLLLCFLSPFFVGFDIGSLGQMKFDSSNIEQFNIDFDKTSINYSKIQCENLIIEKLKENNIIVDNISVVIDKKAETLQIFRIDLSVDNKEKAEEILINELKIDKKVIFINGDE